MTKPFLFFQEPVFHQCLRLEVCAPDTLNSVQCLQTQQLLQVSTHSFLSGILYPAALIQNSAQSLSLSGYPFPRQIGPRPHTRTVPQHPGLAPSLPLVYPSLCSTRMEVHHPREGRRSDLLLPPAPHSFAPDVQQRQPKKLTMSADKV